MENSFLNKEISNDVQLSGAGYVAAVMKSEEGGELCKIIMASPRFCGHQNRICVKCAHEWAWDYTILWDRTVAGRKMKEELDRGTEDRL
jgi:hypothetical protein